MTDDKQKQYKTEWSFSFEKLGEQIGEFARQMGVPGEDAIKQETFVEPIDGAQSAVIRVDLSVGEHTVRTLPVESLNLIEADLTYVGEIKFVVSGAETRSVTLSQTSGAGALARGFVDWINSSNQRRLKWDVALSPNLPITLDVRGGVGQAKLDLSALQSGDLTLKLGTGQVNAILPGGQRYKVDVDAGIGEFNLTIPAQTQVALDVDAGTGEVNIDMGAGCSGTVAIKGGVGEFNLTLPDGVAIRVEAHTGIGGVKVHGHGLRKVRGGDDFMGGHGVWETPNYESAESTIAVRFDGGIGSLNVR